MPKGMGKRDLSVPSQFLLPLGILAPSTFLDAPAGKGWAPCLIQMGRLRPVFLMLSPVCFLPLYTLCWGIPPSLFL